MEVIEPKYTPAPNMVINSPAVIGFLLYLNGPCVIKTGGGFSGTGVPFDLKKIVSVHNTNDNPAARSKTEITAFHGLKTNCPICSVFSKYKGKITNVKVTAAKNKPAIGASILRFLLFPVAMLYILFTNFAYIVFLLNYFIEI